MTTDHRTATNRFTGVVLAGGRSTRMGRDKAEVVFRGRPLWQHQLATLRAAGASEPFLSGRDGGRYSGSGVRVVGDEPWGEGALVGLASAIACVGEEYLIVLAIDLPLMTPHFLRELAHLALAHRSTVIPWRAGRFEPLAAVYRRNVMEPIRGQLARSEYSLQKLAEALIIDQLAIAHAVTPEQERYFTNLNTPADLAELEAMEESQQNDPRI